MVRRYVSREMALDAGDPSLEGSLYCENDEPDEPACTNCGGDLVFAGYAGATPDDVYEVMLCPNCNRTPQSTKGEPKP